MKKGSAKDDRSKDRHLQKPFQLRIHPAVWSQLVKLTERNASKLTTEIQIAIREKLEREGLWPPPSPEIQA